MKSVISLSMLALLLFQCAKSQPVQPFIKPSDPVIQSKDTSSTLDNGILTLKLDLTRGGAISYLSLSASRRSIVNIADEGRYIQQSYYAGKSVDRRAEGQAAGWSPWSWNPIQVGDYNRHRAQILAFQKTGNELYVKCIPMQWDMNNRPAEAEMEQWTTLQGAVLKVHNKLTVHRTDLIYGDSIVNDQELPAVYPISALKNLYTYRGNAPYTNANPENPTVINLSSGFWGIYPNVTEHWMAFLDDNLWGMGIYNPSSDKFLAGLAGTIGGEATDGSTSYIAPVKQAMLTKKCVYEYDYYVIVGTLAEIRSAVYKLH
ncbi:MAG: hypothetical protein WCL21_00705 [Mariniphaga sp.]